MRFLKSYLFFAYYNKTNHIDTFINTFIQDINMKKLMHNKIKKIDDKTGGKKIQKEIDRIADMYAQRFIERLNKFEYVDKDGQPIITDKDRLKSLITTIQMWGEIPSHIKTRAGVIKIRIDD